MSTKITNCRIATGHLEGGDFWDIRFTDPFSSAPVVLLTAKELLSTDAKTTVVGIVQAVIPHGFRLAAGNSYCGAGKAGFTWVAIGIHAQ